MGLLQELKMLKFRVGVAQEGDEELRLPLDLRVARLFSDVKARVWAVFPEKKSELLQEGSAALTEAGVCRYGHGKSAEHYFCDIRALNQECTYRNGMFCASPSTGYTPLYPLNVKK